VCKRSGPPKSVIVFGNGYRMGWIYNTPSFRWKMRVWWWALSWTQSRAQISGIAQGSHNGGAFSIWEGIGTMWHINGIQLFINVETLTTFHYTTLDPEWSIACTVWIFKSTYQFGGGVPNSHSFWAHCISTKPIKHNLHCLLHRNKWVFSILELLIS
jgi:hypothetical protein